MMNTMTLLECETWLIVVLQNENEPPSVIVAGSATWSIKQSNASVHALEEYSLNLTRLVQVTLVL